MTPEPSGDADEVEVAAAIGTRNPRQELPPPQDGFGDFLKIIILGEKFGFGLRISLCGSDGRSLYVTL